MIIRAVVRGASLIGCTILVLAALAYAQNMYQNRHTIDETTASAPEYKISFTEGQPVAGVGAIPAIRLPFECSEDGSVFIHIVQPANWGKPPSNFSANSLFTLLASISTDNRAQSFPLDTVPGLYDIRQFDDYVSSTKVVFLLNATPEDKQAKSTYSDSTGQEHEYTNNTAPHHFYIVLFDRNGQYEEKIQVQDSFEISHIGLFPSGKYLVYGFSQTDQSPQMALLKEDGTLLQYVSIPKGDVPKSAKTTLNGTGKGPAIYVAPTQFMGQSGTIYVLQNNANYPILGIDPGGGVHVIRPELRKGLRISMLIPSDNNLYGRMNDTSSGSIYEFNPGDGSITRRFEVPNDQSGADIACVHGDKFISFKQVEGNLVPLLGKAVPMGR
jgi:hypothetical protein